VAAPPERFLVWGAGGHGKVVGELVRSCDHELVGFVDRDPDKLGEVVEPGGARVVMGEEPFQEPLGPLPGGPFGVVPAIGRNAARLATLALLGTRLSPALVHPAATVSRTADVGEGSVVLAGAVVNAASRVGRGAIINTAAVVEHDCELTDGVHISPGAVVSGGVRIGCRAWIGAGSVVIEGIRVGRDAIVGAGAVVVRDVPDRATVVGNPARRIR